MEERVMYLLKSGSMLYKDMEERVYTSNRGEFYQTVQQMLDRKQIEYEPGTLRLRIRK